MSILSLISSLLEPHFASHLVHDRLKLLLLVDIVQFLETVLKHVGADDLFRWKVTLLV